MNSKNICYVPQFIQMPICLYILSDFTCPFLLCIKRNLSRKLHLKTKWALFPSKKCSIKITLHLFNKTMCNERSSTMMLPLLILHNEIVPVIQMRSNWNDRNTFQTYTHRNTITYQECEQDLAECARVCAVEDLYATRFREFNKRKISNWIERMTIDCKQCVNLLNCELN